jgi:hypothetical protein
MVCEAFAALLAVAVKSVADDRVGLRSRPDFIDFDCLSF